MEASLRFYIDGLGFKRTNQWIVDDKIRWCWLQLGGASLMLQEYRDGDSRFAAAKLGLGVSVCFQCRDAIAIYRETRTRGLQAQTPFVGNGLWVTAFHDPDGYNVDFESLTQRPRRDRLLRRHGLIHSRLQITENKSQTMAYFSSPENTPV